MNLLKDKLWMVKVPEVIYNQAMRQKDLGELEIYEVTNNVGQQETKLKVNLSERITPSNFDINFDKTNNFFTFKDKKNRVREVDYTGRFVASDESVSDSVTMNATREEVTNKPMISIERGKGRPKTEGIIPLSERQYFAINETKQRALQQKNRRDRNLKKTRKDRDELKGEIFDLFTEKDFWTNKELVATLDQPENYLKEVLSEMCDYIRSGPKKGCYELKRQYMRTKHEDEGFS